jgi:hypothetical protein
MVSLRLKFVMLRCSVRSMARPHAPTGITASLAEGTKPNQSLEPMARYVTPRAGHEARRLSPWLTIKR